MSELADIQNEIGSSWRNLQAEWSEVRSVWNDSIAEEFERKYWFELENEMLQLISAMEELDEVYRQADFQLQGYL